MQDNTENLPYLKFEFQDPRNGKTTTKILPMTHEGMEQMKEFDKLTEQYNEEFNILFNSLCPQFDMRLSAIGGWIDTEYHIMPTKKEFIEWFIRTKIGTFKMNTHFRLNDNDEYSDEIEEHREYIDFWFPDYKNTFIPNLIDDYLLEYCQEYVNDLKLKREKILLKLSTPDQVEDGKTVIKKIKEGDISWNTKALFMYYRKKAGENFTFQNTLSYFKCTDTNKYKPNYKQLHKAFTNMGRTKDRCLPTNRKDILSVIQELEKLESCKKSLKIAQAEYDDFNVNYPIQ